MAPLRLILGLAAALVALFALAWNDALPAGDALRSMFVDDASSAETGRRVHRAGRLSRFAREREVDADVLLIGASTIEHADDGLLAPTGLAVVNRGIADEPLGLLAERFEPTVRETGPELVVLDAGGVDARRPTRSAGSNEPPTEWRRPDELAGEIGAMVDGALAARPGLRVLVLEVLPEAAPPPEVPERIRALNAALRGLAATRPRVDVLGTWRAPLVDDTTGALRQEVTVDGVHMGPAGYDALGRWLRAHPWVSEAVMDARLRAAERDGAAGGGADGDGPPNRDR